MVKVHLYHMLFCCNFDFFRKSVTVIFVYWNRLHFFVPLFIHENGFPVDFIDRIIEQYSVSDLSCLASKAINIYIIFGTDVKPTLIISYYNSEHKVNRC